MNVYLQVEQCYNLDIHEELQTYLRLHFHLQWEVLQRESYTAWLHTCSWVFIPALQSNKTQRVLLLSLLARYKSTVWCHRCSLSKMMKIWVLRLLLHLTSSAYVSKFGHFNSSFSSWNMIWEFTFFSYFFLAGEFNYTSTYAHTQFSQTAPFGKSFFSPGSLDSSTSRNL